MTPRSQHYAAVFSQKMDENVAGLVNLGHDVCGVSCGNQGPSVSNPDITVPKQERFPMKIRFFALVLLIAGLASPALAVNHDKDAAMDPAPVPTEHIAALADGEHRSEANKARNAFRNPVETLAFFGLTPDMTVVELWPGGGWYTEILAPYVRDEGAFYAAGFDQEATSGYPARLNAAYAEKLAARPDLYDHVIVTELSPPAKLEIAPAGSADMVLTFRNLHNWMGRGQLFSVLEAAFKALKPGGILGVVEHRGDPDMAQDPEAKSGYVSQDFAIKLAESAGFELLATSEVNANAKDDRDHPAGVWTLPPSLRLGEEDRDVYMAIGESDRMTLKFIKPVE